MKNWGVALTALLFTFVLSWPAMVSAQAKVEWRDFSSVDGEFKISTPTILKQTENGTPGGNTENPSRAYVFGGVRPFMAIGVRYTDYEKLPEVMDDSELRSQYDRMRTAQVEAAKGTLISDTDINLGGNLGREVFIKTSASIHAVRWFLVNKRLYQVSVSINILAENKKPVTDERQRILDSFSISRTATSAALIPDNYQGAFKDNVYRSEFLDFSIDLINGWRVLNENETDLLKESAKDFYRKDDGTLASVVEKSFRQSAILLMQRRMMERSAGIMIYVETTNSPGRPIKETALLGQNTIKKYSNLPFTVTKEGTEAMLDGEKFITYDALLGHPETQVKQRYFIGMRKKLVLTISLSYVDESDLKTLEKALGTIKFGKK